MRSTSLAQLSVRLAEWKNLVAAGVVIAAAVALLIGDPHSIGMTHN
jgi:hypothetical protein